MMEAGRDMDALIAERVMGYTVERGIAEYDGMEMPWMVFHDATGQTHNPTPYSTDIAAAWGVVEKMHAHGFNVNVNILHYWRDKFECIVYPPDDRGWEVSVSADAPTAPLAVCRAALKAFNSGASAPAPAGECTE